MYNSRSKYIRNLLVALDRGQINVDQAEEKLQVELEEIYSQGRESGVQEGSEHG